MLPRRPDFIDRWYELVEPIARLTDEIDRLAKEGLALSTAGEKREAASILKRCEKLAGERRAAQDRYDSLLRARGLK